MISATVGVIVAVMLASWIAWPKPVAGSESVNPLITAQVREVVRQKRLERIVNAAKQSDFGLAKSHLLEILVGSHLSIRSNAHGQIRFAVSEDSTNQGQEWNYDLVESTNGWKIIGYGYRGRKMTP